MYAANVPGFTYKRDMIISVPAYLFCDTTLRPLLILNLADTTIFLYCAGSICLCCLLNSALSWTIEFF